MVAQTPVLRRFDWVPVPAEVFETFLARRPTAAAWAVLFVILYDCYGPEHKDSPRLTIAELCERTGHTRRAVQAALWTLQGLKPGGAPDRARGVALLGRRRTTGDELRQLGRGYVYYPLFAPVDNQAAATDESRESAINQEMESRASATVKAVKGRESATNQEMESRESATVAPLWKTTETGSGNGLATDTLNDGRVVNSSAINEEEEEENNSSVSPSGYPHPPKAAADTRGCGGAASCPYCRSLIAYVAAEFPGEPSDQLIGALRGAAWPHPVIGAALLRAGSNLQVNHALSSYVCKLLRDWTVTDQLAGIMAASSARRVAHQLDRALALGRR